VLRIYNGGDILTIKIVGGEQIVCDCLGNTPATYQDRLLVGLVVRKDDVIFEVHCPLCEHCKQFIVSNKLALSWTTALDLIQVH